MRALIVTRPSLLELHGDTIRMEIDRGFVDPSYLAVIEAAHIEHYACRKALAEILRKRSVAYVESTREKQIDDISGYDGVFTVGGDGTVLAASHHVTNDQIPLIGIKSSQTSIGHLCVCDQTEMEYVVDTWITGNLSYLACARFQAEISRLESSKTFLSGPCLNDALFTNVHPAATTRYHLIFGDKTEMQRSSGVWIATATGSSAGISAAGGKIMEPTATDFQFRVREPFKHKRATLCLEHGFFSPENISLTIINQSEVSILALDGAHLQLTVNLGDRIKFARAKSLALASRTTSA